MFIALSLSRSYLSYLGDGKAKAGSSFSYHLWHRCFLFFRLWTAGAVVLRASSSLFVKLKITIWARILVCLYFGLKSIPLSLRNKIYPFPAIRQEVPLTRPFNFSFPSSLLCLPSSHFQLFPSLIFIYFLLNDIGQYPGPPRSCDIFTKTNRLCHVLSVFRSERLELVVLAAFLLSFASLCHSSTYIPVYKKILWSLANLVAGICVYHSGSSSGKVLLLCTNCRYCFILRRGCSSIIQLCI